MDSIIGKICIADNDKGICQIGLNVSSKERFLRDIQQRFPMDVCLENASCLLSRFVLDLKKYLHGDRVIFDYAVDLTGATEFQIKVWKEVQKIPYGKTATYKEIAFMIGSPNAPRAVGLANKSNPVPIIIPCHRVIGINGQLKGFSAGLRVKEQLLCLENKGVTIQQFSF